MKITGKQLRRIIREAVSEVNGALNEKFHDLAVLIRDRYDALKGKHRPGTEWSFLIPKSEFRNYNVYNLPYANVRVYVSPLDTGYFAACWNNLVYLYPRSFEGMEERLIPFLEHELTHMVQGEGTKKYIGFKDDNGAQSVNYDNNYVFTPYEMSARISEAYRFCQQELESYLTEAYFMDLGNVGEASFHNFYNIMWDCLNDEAVFYPTLNDSLHLTEMENIISAVKNDTYENFTNSLREDNYESPLAGFMMDTPYYLGKLMRLKNWDDKRTFEQARLYVLSTLERLYADYRKKINKTLAPLAMRYFERGLEDYK